MYRPVISYNMYCIHEVYPFSIAMMFNLNAFQKIVIITSNFVSLCHQEIYNLLRRRYIANDV